MRYLVNTGCGEFAFMSIEEVVGFIEMYMREPSAIRRLCDAGGFDPERPVLMAAESTMVEAGG